MRSIKMKVIQGTHPIVDKRLHQNSSLVDQFCQMKPPYQSEEAEATLICNQYISKDVCHAEIQTIIVKLKESINLNQKKIDVPQATLICNQYISNDVYHAQVQTEIEEFDEMQDDDLNHPCKAYKTQACQVEIPCETKEAGTTLICNRYFSKNLWHVEIQTEIKEFPELIHAESEKCVRPQLNSAKNKESRLDQSTTKELKNGCEIVSSLQHQSESSSFEFVATKDTFADKNEKRRNKPYYKNSKFLEYYCTECDITKEVNNNCSEREQKKCNICHTQMVIQCYLCKKQIYTTTQGLKAHLGYDCTVQRQYKDLALKYCRMCMETKTSSKVTKTSSQNLCEECESPLSWQCSMCKVLMGSYRAIAMHLFDTCLPPTFFNCPNCDFKTLISTELEEHRFKRHQYKVALINNIESAECTPLPENNTTPNCEFLPLNVVSIVQKEMRNDTGNKPQKYNYARQQQFIICLKCKQVFKNSSSDLNEHNKICAKRVLFTGKKQLRRIKPITPEIRKFKEKLKKKSYVICRKCRLGIKNIPKVINIHTAKCGKEPLFMCAHEECMYKGYYKREVVSHLKSEHVDFSVDEIGNYIIDLSEYPEVENSPNLQSAIDLFGTGNKPQKYNYARQQQFITCLKCKQILKNSPSDLNEHNKICAKRVLFTGKNQLRRIRPTPPEISKIKEKLKKISYFVCPRCKLGIKNDPKVINIHTAKCGKEPLFKCAHKGCMYKGYFKSEVVSHLKSEHVGFSVDEIEKHVVDLSEYAEVENSPDLRSGRDTIVSNNQENCDSEINIISEKAKDQPLPIERDNLSKYTCSHCSFQAVRECDMTRHLRRDHHVDEQEIINYYGRTRAEYIVCQKCKVKVKNHYTLLSKHRKTCGKVASFRCRHCGYKAFYKSDIRSHLKRSHKNIDTSTCDIDGHFIDISEREITQPQEKFYKCSRCDYKTLKKSDRERHNFLQHQQKYVVCQTCKQKVLNIPTIVSMHKKKCGKLPSYKCAYCYIQAFYKSDIRSHLKRKHKHIDLSVGNFEDHCIELHKGNQTNKSRTVTFATVTVAPPDSAIESSTTSRGQDAPFEFIPIKEEKSDDENNRKKLKDSLPFTVLPIASYIFSEQSQIDHQVATSQTNLDCGMAMEEIEIKEESIESYSLPMEVTEITQEETNPLDGINVNSSEDNNKTYDLRNQFRFVNIDQILGNNVEASAASRNSNIVTCDKCKKDFPYRRELVRHLNSCTGKAFYRKMNSGSFICADCGLTFGKPYALARHRKNYCKKRAVVNDPANSKSVKSKGRRAIYHSTEIEFIIKRCAQCNRWRCFNKKYTATKQSMCKGCNIPILWECSKCCKQFRDFERICHHLKEPCSNKVYNCLGCGIEYGDVESLKNHTKQEHPENVKLMCLKCGKIFPNPPALCVHNKKCGNVAHLICNHCSFRAYVNTDMRQHLRRVHKFKLDLEDHYSEDKNLSWLNSTNQVPIQGQDEITLPVNSTVQEAVQGQDKIASNAEEDRKVVKKYKSPSFAEFLNKYCPKCKRTLKFNVRSSVNLQKICNMCKVRNVWLCVKCNEHFERYELIADHFPCNNQRLFKCPECRYKSLSGSDLHEHVLNCHGNKKYSVCEKCGETSKDKSRSGWSTHVKKCGNKRSIQCKSCHYQALYLHEMKRHLKRVHHVDEDDSNIDDHYSDIEDDNSGRPLTKTDFMEKYCPECKVTRKISRATRASQQTMCKECCSDILWQCAACKKQMVTFKQLNLHVLTNCNPNKLYECDDCEYKNAKKYSLIKHIVQNHMEDNHYICQECNKKVFYDANSLSKHKKRCGKKAHLQCVHCKFFKGFYPGEVKRHLKKVHMYIDLSLVKLEDQYVDISESQNENV